MWKELEGLCRSLEAELAREGLNEADAHIVRYVVAVMRGRNPDRFGVEHLMYLAFEKADDLPLPLGFILIEMLRYDESWLALGADKADKLKPLFKRAKNLALQRLGLIKDARGFLSRDLPIDFEVGLLAASLLTLTQDSPLGFVGISNEYYAPVRVREDNAISQRAKNSANSPGPKKKRSDKAAARKTAYLQAMECALHKTGTGKLKGLRLLLRSLNGQRYQTGVPLCEEIWIEAGSIVDTQGSISESRISKYK